VLRASILPCVSKYALVESREFSDLRLPRMRRFALSLVCCATCTLFSCGGSGNRGNGSGGGGNSQPEVLYAAYYTPNGGGAGGYIVPMSISGNGTLTQLTQVLGPGNAVTIATDQQRKFLYSSDFNTNTIYAYAIDASSGNLTPLAGSPYQNPSSGNGGPLAVDPVGNFLFVADSVGDITTYTRNSDGTLTLSTAPIVTNRYQPIQLVVASSGKFLYTANHSDFTGGGQISVYSIDATTSALSEISGSPFNFVQSNSEPWGLALSADDSYLFTALSNTGQIAALSVNSSTGAVTEIANSPFAVRGTLPEQLVISPSGKYLYAGIASVGSIRCFSIDATSGSLTELQASQTNVNYTLAIDSGGNYLFSSPKVLSSPGVVWQIDQSSGALSQLGNIPSVNGAPTAMKAITLP
jgi:6-phosphogluconolactonase (cycloisomerase 2 family)